MGLDNVAIHWPAAPGQTFDAVSEDEFRPYWPVDAPVAVGIATQGQAAIRGQEYDAIVSAILGREGALWSWWGAPLPSQEWAQVMPPPACAAVADALERFVADHRRGHGTTVTGASVRAVLAEWGQAMPAEDSAPELPSVPLDELHAVASFFRGVVSGGYAVLAYF